MSAAQERRPEIGVIVKIPDHTTCEAVLPPPVGRVMLDLQHGRFGLSAVPGLAQLARALGVEVLCRVREADPATCAWLADVGVHHIVLPTVESVDEVAAVTTRLRFPPLGRRSAPGSTLDSVTAPGLIPLVETVDGVAIAPKLARLELVESLLVGPVDLAASLGLRGPEATPGPSAHRSLVEAYETVARACRDAGVPASSTAQSAASVRWLRQLGFTRFLIGVDLAFLQAGTWQAIQHMEQV